MYQIPELTEIGILIAMGGVNTFLAMLLFKENKKGSDEKEKEPKKKEKEREVRKEKKTWKLKKEGKAETKAETSSIKIDEPKEKTEVKKVAVLYQVIDGSLSEPVLIDEKLAGGGEYKIGGKASSDFVIKNKFVSGTHAIISKRGDRYYIMDVSRNGTKLSAIPYRGKDNDPMMYRIELGKEEELFNRIVIELAENVVLIFEEKEVEV